MFLVLRRWCYWCYPLHNGFKPFLKSHLNIHEKKEKVSIPSNVSQNRISKVEKILKGSLDSIPSPSFSVQIQIMDWKVCLRCKDKTLLGIVKKLFVFKSLLTSPSNVLPYYLPQFNFPSNI